MTIAQFGTFFRTILVEIASFLGTEPIIYIFGLFIMLFVIGIFRRLLTVSR